MWRCYDICILNDGKAGEIDKDEYRKPQDYLEGLRI